MNAWQRRCCEVYAGGEYADLKDDDWRARLGDIGDGLFSFLMIELSDQEGCDSWDEAINRFETISTEIMICWTEIITSWENNLRKEGHDPR